jgi:hypothetical protein
MKKILILVLLWIVLFSGEGGGLIPTPKPKVNVGDFISDFEAIGYAGLFHMLPSVGADEVVPPKPDNNVVKECRCVKTNGKISFDGGTSWTDCPCKIGQCDCGCVNSSKSTEIKDVQKKDLVRNYADLYYILRITSASCAPCKSWANRETVNFKNAKIAVVDIDQSSDLARRANNSRIPHFIVVTKVDSLFHFKDDSKTEIVGEYIGSDFTVEKAYDLMAELDKHLHPNIGNGIVYDRKQKSETKLNNKVWATKQEYLGHLTNDNDHSGDIIGWPLVELSTYELKAIHDDDHANKLGELNGL